MTVRYKNTRGFTLVELLVTLSIVGYLLTAVAVNFRGGQETDAIHLASQRLVDALETAHTNAIAGVTLADGVTVPSGYGVNIAIPPSPTAAFVTTFADTGSTKNKLDVSDTQTQARLDASVAYPLAISALDYCYTAPCVGTGAVWTAAPATKVDVAFDVPMGSTKLDDDAIVSPNTTPPIALRITLQSLRDTSITRAVYVNRITGRVEADY